MASWNLRSLFFFSNSSAFVRTRGILSEGLSTSPLNRELYLPLTKYKDGLQSRMREAHMEPHTVRSHGFTLARTHRHDWLILILLMALVVLLNLIHPFKRFVGKDMMDDLKYPLKDNTIPVWSVPVYAVLLPIIVFLLFYSRRHDVYDLHHAILGILYSVLVTGVITDAIKVAVGRPRPNFFWRCFPDGKDAYDHWGNVICHGAKNILKEGHKSFPSGHTSWSFAGLGFLSLYLAGKIRAFDSRGHVAKLCVVFLPLTAACLVAISRVDDYWHHWQDVFAGGLIGLVIASFCYLQFFPPPYHIDGWATYAYFRIVEESRRHIRSNHATDNNDSQNLDIRAANERNNDAFREVSEEVEDVESGRREVSEEVEDVESGRR